MAFAGLRLLALAAAWYALVVLLAGAVARLASPGRVVAVVDRITVPPLRRLLAATAGVGITVGAVSSAALGVAGHPMVAVAAPAPAPAGPTTPVPAPSDRPGPPPTVTMHRLPPGIDPPAASLGPTPTPAPAPGPTPPAPAAPPGPAEGTAPATWTVRPGQCFWSIAEAVLDRAWGRRPTPAEIVPYWRRLIEANRSVLAHRDNPDLIFSGQVFTVPVPPPRR